MNLIIVLLLMAAALAVAVRIWDAGRIAFFAMLMVLCAFALGRATFPTMVAERDSAVASTNMASGSAMAAETALAPDPDGSPNEDSGSSDESSAADNSPTLSSANTATVVLEQNDEGPRERRSKSRKRSLPQANDPAAETDESNASESPSAPKEAENADALVIETEPETGGVVIPPRPPWVESDPDRSGEVHTTAVSSGPHETEQACREYLNRELERAVAEYVDWYLGRVYGQQFHASTFVRYDLETIKSRLVADGKLHHEVIKVSFGPMHQMHALLEFDKDFRAELDGRRAELQRHWREWVVRGRLLGTALGMAVVLALLAVLFGYFRADTATRGFYTGRLQLVATLVILGVLLGGVVLANRILLSL